MSYYDVLEFSVLQRVVVVQPNYRFTVEKCDRSTRVGGQQYTTGCELNGTGASQETRLCPVTGSYEFYVI